MTTGAIRPAREADRAALYDVCVRTGDAGNDASAMLDDPSLYGHLYAGQYLTFAPEFALVLEVGSEVAGYAVGVIDSAEFEDRLEREWWPPLRSRYPLPASGPASGSVSGSVLDRVLIERIHRPYRTDERLASRYPSHLHIDLLPAAQGHGHGRALMDSLFERFAAAGSRGVHLGVDPRNDAAIRFYEHLGLRRHDPDGGVLFTQRFDSPEVAQRNP